MKKQIKFLKNIVWMLRNTKGTIKLNLEDVATAIESLLIRTERMEEYQEFCKKQNEEVINLKAENKRLKENKLEKEHWMELAKVYEKENQKLKHINEVLSSFSEGTKSLNNSLKGNWIHKLELIDLKNYYLNYDSPYYEEELLIRELVSKIDDILK